MVIWNKDTSSEDTASAEETLLESETELDIADEFEVSQEEKVERHAKRVAHGYLDKFLEPDKSLELLFLGDPVVDKVPLRPKDNVYFLVDNRCNVQ